MTPLQSGFYERLLTIQNAAVLQWPATDPANAGYP